MVQTSRDGHQFCHVALCVSVCVSVCVCGVQRGLLDCCDIAVSHCTSQFLYHLLHSLQTVSVVTQYLTFVYLILRRENEVALQWAGMRMVRWMCDIYIVNE